MALIGYTAYADADDPTTLFAAILENARMLALPKGTQLVQLRCICLDLKFVDLMKIARKRGITDVDELSELTGCGTKCGSCMSYLEELLRSGKLKVGDQLVDFPIPEDETNHDR